MDLNNHKDVMQMLRSRGFSLIELMVSLALISITLLGSAKLQVFSQQVFERAHYSGQALQLIDDTSNRIHLNFALRDSYLVSSVTNVSAINCNPCSPEALVQLDLYHLSIALKTLLPMSEASIQRCDQGICMRVIWSDDSLGSCFLSVNCIERPLL